MTPKELRQCLIRGLKPELKSYVISHNPDTLEQVIERINLGEAVGKISHKKESVNSLDSDRLAAVLTAAVNQIDFKVDAWKRDRDGAGTTGIRSANYQLGRPQPVQEDREQHMTRSYKPTGVVCWNCQRTGHMTRDCRIPQTGRMNIGHWNNNGNGRVGTRGWRPGNNMDQTTIDQLEGWDSNQVELVDDMATVMDRECSRRKTFNDGIK